MNNQKVLQIGIDLKLQSLRVLIRKNSKKIIDHVINNHVIRKNGKPITNTNPEICMFCGSYKNITKEHVIPRWLYDNNTTKHFITNLNGLSQTYNKTTIPTCLDCNTSLLNTLEKYIQQLFLDIDLTNRYFFNYEMEKIVRWLEIIDYKYQILNIRRKFRASKEKGYIPYLADFPISILRHDIPSKAISEIRKSLNRITVKEKTRQLNSLVVFHTSNPDYYFFHTMDEFIFIELPKYRKALFYFYKKEFKTKKDAYKAANKIINEVY